MIIYKRRFDENRHIYVLIKEEKVKYKLNILNIWKF